MKETAAVILFAERGFGYGEGSIGVQARLAEGSLTQHSLDAADAIIRTDPSIFVKIAHHIQDDGCGDGRRAVATWATDGHGNAVHFNKSYPRAKLFGGGLVVSSSMWRSIAGMPMGANTVLGDRMFIANELKTRGVPYGGHCGGHVDGEACGCAAIDQYHEITDAILRYKDKIIESLAYLYGDSFDQTMVAVTHVFAGYEKLAADNHYFSDAAGQKTMDFMSQDGAVLKRLDDDHLECIFIFNDVNGETFDQPQLDAKLRSEGISEIVQAFVVDVWRGRMYAELVASIARANGVQGDVRQLTQIAYADFLIRTLAVAARLTRGDLRVYARNPIGKNNFSLTS